jgi:hypothetical protein
VYDDVSAMLCVLHSTRCPFGTSASPQVQIEPELLAPEQAAVAAAPRNAIVDFQCLRIRFLRGPTFLHVAYRVSAGCRNAGVTTRHARLTGKRGGPGTRPDLVSAVTGDETGPQGC